MPTHTWKIASSSSRETVFINGLAKARLKVRIMFFSLPPHQRPSFSRLKNRRTSREYRNGAVHRHAVIGMPIVVKGDPYTLNNPGLPILQRI
jgi:hypothetical protein